MTKRITHFLSLLICMGISGFVWSQVTTYNYTGSLQTYTVPAGVDSIKIEVGGGQGGGGLSGVVGGEGAIIIGDFTVTPGEELTILVGGEGIAGTDDTEQAGGSGGGGSFVVNSADDPVIISGGGGGAMGRYDQLEDGGPGQAGEDGQDGEGAGGAGGTAGNGGGTWPWTGWHSGTGGGGFYTDGSADSNGSTSYGTINGRGMAYVNGGAGGTAGSLGRAGGYGGGGAAGFTGAGGGGYSGGGSGTHDEPADHSGGGGGSYNSGSNQSNTTGGNTGNGYVIITELCTGLETTVSSDTVCVGDEVTLHAESIGSGTVSWSGGITDSVAFTPSAGTTTYTATSTDGDDCAFVIDIFVGDYPTADAGMDTSICEGDSIQLAGTGSGTDMMWDGGFSDGDWVTPTTAGTNAYELTVSVDSTGCATVDTLEVEYNVIDATVTNTAGTLSSATSGATYQWVDCSDTSDISGATSQDFTPSQNGDYAVIVDLNGCVDTSACQSITDVGIENLGGTQSIVAYPNPTTGVFNVELKGQFNFEMTNAIGQIIQKGKATDKKVFDLSEMENGIYFVNIISSDDKHLVKVIKQ